MKFLKNLEIFLFGGVKNIFMTINAEQQSEKLLESLINFIVSFFFFPEVRRVLILYMHAYAYINYNVNKIDNKKIDRIGVSNSNVSDFSFQSDHKAKVSCDKISAWSSRQPFPLGGSIDSFVLWEVKPQVVLQLYFFLCIHTDSN